MLYFDCVFFFFNDTATTEIYTLSLHDALPICLRFCGLHDPGSRVAARRRRGSLAELDRKGTRLNSSHQIISYAVFCLKKKKNFSACSSCGWREHCRRGVVKCCRSCDVTVSGRK